MRVQTNSVRNSQSPLTTEQLQHYVPSAFAVTPYHKMSDRYGFIPTSEVIEGMRSAGFLPFAASQSRTSIEDKRGFTKHVIRFRTPEMAHQAVGASRGHLEAIHSRERLAPRLAPHGNQEVRARRLPGRGVHGLLLGGVVAGRVFPDGHAQAHAVEEVRDVA